MTEPIRTHLRLTFPGGHPFSHGKADLMDWIRQTGSIRQAAQKMDMSYRRAWLLMNELNHMFDEPVIGTQQGGKTGGGAELTPFGSDLLDRFRAMEAKAKRAIDEDLDWIEAHRRQPDKA